jgi:hypothetical protein
MVKPHKWPLWLLCLGLGCGVLGGIAQQEMPLLLKEAALMLPLQIAALLYVAWYWRDRQARRP